MIEPVLNIQDVKLEGRWVCDYEARSLMTAWAGSSISFIFSGTNLKLVCGERTERKDKWNGGVPMLAVSMIPDSASVPRSQYKWTMLDPQSGSTLHLIEKEEATPSEILVKVMMVDWASQFELKCLLTNEEATIRGPPIVHRDRILFIGDSISCGYFVQQDGSPIPGHTPRGCLDAFPYVAQRLLSVDQSYNFDVDLVAYPGWALVSPTDEEQMEGNPLGMLKGYFQISPWMVEQYDYKYWADVSAIVIELGTNDQEYYSAERFVADLHAFLLNLAQQIPSMSHILVVPPFGNEGQPTGFQQEFSAIIEKLRKEFTQLDICDITVCIEHIDTIDGIHPSVEGHRKLGIEMARFIHTRLVDPSALRRPLS
ncbi:hypothetical protein RSOLAG1IB_05855 [Rhizoctonia solani AG-1 IB]|uniref:SGNH hydrolase-type esterase domain-containing protein n=1 Tax=Thanatephorus cucumeris (strain AG1-IB / isolate 7/3/14) TaxID=1108050 RepID=A0A0B7F554_THACB|nr:hypothetical protein RSOLAG1IB_05855 [Rhizoctonia solani AG-1 IB]